VAAGKGHAKVVQMLMGKEGVDVKIKDRKGKIPVVLATEKGHKEVVQVLLRKGGMEGNC
jgi:hypothetical protein